MPWKPQKAFVVGKVKAKIIIISNQIDEEILLWLQELRRLRKV